MKNKIVVLALVSSLHGCGAEDLVQDVIDAIDNAVYTLDQNSAEYQNIINNLLVQLENIDEELSTIIRSDIGDLVARTPAVIGQEFRCNVDFVNERLQRGLQCAKRNFMVSNLYSGNTPLPNCDSVSPTVCAVVPSAIQQDLNQSVVDIYGYDLDLGVNSFVTEDANSLDVTEYTSFPSHYHMTLNIGDNGVPNIYGYDELELSHNDVVISTISIIQGDVCRIINPGSRTILLQEYQGCLGKSGILPGGISISASMEISENSDRLDVNVLINDLDYVTRRYSETVDKYTLFYSPSGTSISSDTVLLDDSFLFYDDDNRINYIERGNSGLVNQYEMKVGFVSCATDTGYVKITYNSIEVCTIPK